VLRNKLHILICLFCLVFTTPVWAQDTLYLNDMVETADMDSILEQLMAEQARRLFVKDSLRQDSLYHDLLRQEYELTQRLFHVRDSIWMMSPMMPEVQQQIQDSIELDKQAAVQALNDHKRSLGLDIAPSLVYDAQEDMQEIREAMRNRKSNWRKSLNLSLQFTQNYITPNWYKGGESSFAGLGIQKGELQYNKKNLSWYSMAEWRFGMTTVASDTLRKYNVTDDLFRIYSKIGYQVVKNLDIATSVDFQTNFFYTWNTNQRTSKTAPFSPIRFNLAVGIDYKPIKNMSIAISPLAYKLVYSAISDPEKIDVTKFGIEKGKDILNDVGSSIRLTYKYQPVREIMFDTEFYFYTNYEMVEIDWEVNCNFIINRFITARLSLRPRYDSSLLSEDGKAHIQFKELLSIGFAHHFK